MHTRVYDDFSIIQLTSSQSQTNFIVIIINYYFSVDN